MATMKRPTRKIPMQKRDSREKLHVTFTKRRAGLFHKASELSRLCDAQVAVLVSSPNGRYYHSFSPTSVDPVLDAFLAGRVPEPVADSVKWEAHRLAKEVDELEGRLRQVKELGKAVDKGECPWEALRKYEENVTTPEELRALYEALSELKAKHGRKAPNTNSGVGSNVLVVDSPGQSYTSTAAAALPPPIVQGLTNNAMSRHETEFPELGRIECRPSSSLISWEEVGMENGSSSSNSYWFPSESLSNSVFLPPGN